MKQKLRRNINGSNSQGFEKINKSDKTLARIIKKKGGKAQITNIRNERGPHRKSYRY